METTLIGALEVHTNGTLPKAGTQAPEFSLVARDLSEFRLKDFRGKRVVLNIFPSLDTEVCAMSVRRFNEEASRLKDTVVICASKDLPFAQARFCAANDIENVMVGSAFRSELGQAYGIQMEDGPLKGLLARCLVVIDRDGTVMGSSFNNVLTEEPDYSFIEKLLK